MLVVRSLAGGWIPTLTEDSEYSSIINAHLTDTDQGLVYALLEEEAERQDVGHMSVQARMALGRKGELHAYCMLTSMTSESRCVQLGLHGFSHSCRTYRMVVMFTT